MKPSVLVNRLLFKTAGYTDIYFFTAHQTQTYIFDENSGKLSRAANISCPKDSVIEILSLEYYSSVVYCTQLVCPEFLNTGYLDGQHHVCQNEDRIRANCYAKQSCSIGSQGINITVPKEQCETGYLKAKQLRVKFSCIKSGMKVKYFSTNMVMCVIYKYIYY